MNHLQKDIDSLESERHHLRENLKAHSVKKGDVKQPITFGNRLKYYFDKSLKICNDTEFYIFIHLKFHRINGCHSVCSSRAHHFEEGIEG